jgi:hypothetical protein
MTGSERRCQVSDVSDSVEFLGKTINYIVEDGSDEYGLLAYGVLIYHFTPSGAMR